MYFSCKKFAGRSKGICTWSCGLGVPKCMGSYVPKGWYISCFVNKLGDKVKYCRLACRVGYKDGTPAKYPCPSGQKCVDLILVAGQKSYFGLCQP